MLILVINVRILLRLSARLRRLDMLLNSLLFTSAALGKVQLGAAPLKVFILGGQSNMEGKGVVFENDGTKINGSLEWQLDVDHSYLPVCPTMDESPRAGCRAQGANFSGLYDNATKNWTSFPNVYAAYKGSHDRNGTMTIGYGFNTNWIGILFTKTVLCSRFIINFRP